MLKKRVIKVCFWLIHIVENYNMHVYNVGFFSLIDGNATWKYNRRAEVLIDHIEKVYDSNDCDLSFITGIFAAIRRTKKSRNPKVSNDRYV